MQSLIQDLRYAIRQLWKSPGFTFTVVLTFAIGIGANTASFSIMDAVVLRPLAVPEMNHVVLVREQPKQGEEQSVALANYLDWQRQSQSFEQLSILGAADMSLTGSGDATHVRAEYASPSFFSVLRAIPLTGRVFGADETVPGRGRVAVLGYAFWKAHFDPRGEQDKSVLGKQVMLDQHPYTVIGVLPKTLQFPAAADFFLPLAPSPAELADRRLHQYTVLGRLRPGVSTNQAQAELNLIAGHLAGAYPGTNEGWSVKVETLLSGINGDLTPLYFSLIQGASFFVLLVVCANVANLQFARGIVRRPEIAMRTALGASRWRLLRQMLTENLLLGLLGGAGGLGFATIYMHFSLATMPERVMRLLAGWSNISLNGRAMAFSFALAIGAGLISGTAPALQALRINLVDQLKAGSRSVMGAGRSNRLRNALALAQISLAVALVIGAALMSKGMLAMLHMADPYRPAKTLNFTVHLPASRYDTPAKQAAWYARSLDLVSAIPGVQHAALTNTLPYSDDGWVEDSQVEDHPFPSGQAPQVIRLPVSPSFFLAFHVPFAVGYPGSRTFTEADTLQTQPVAVISRQYAEKFFPNQNPLGHRIRIGTSGNAPTPWLTIVGVVDETNYSLWERSHPAAVYTSVQQFPPIGLTCSVMTDGDPIALAPAIHSALASLDADLPLDAVETYAQFLNERLTGMYYVVIMLGIDALFALLLAALGIFGVMANLVGERTREIGVRLAVGASREQVLRMILKRAGWLTLGGLVAGLVMASAMARAIASLFYNVSPNDPVVFASIAAVIAVVALLASWLPARRAANLDPMVALHDQ